MASTATTAFDASDVSRCQRSRSVRRRKARPQRRSAALSALLLGAAAFSPAAADFDFPLQDQVLLTEIDPATDAGRLGESVAISNDLVAMGAPFKDAQIGAAYLYRIDGNRNLQFVREFDQPGPPRPLRRYGLAMVADGDLLAVGGTGGGGRDPIQIYRRSGNDYVLIKELGRPDLSAEGILPLSGFGEVIDLEDGFLIVGDSGAIVDGERTGVALIFRQNAGGANNWGLEGILKNPDGEGFFGRSVAIGNNIAVIGDDIEERALLFERDGLTWSFSRLLEPVNQNPQDQFGSSVAAEGDIIAVGAAVGNDAGSASGSVHIFERDAGGEDQFGEVAEVVGSQGGFIDEFGASMRIRDGVLAVGSPNGDRAYLFAVNRSTDTWREVAVVAPPPASNIADFGRSVDYFRGSFVVGAELWSNSSSLRSGAVFLFENEQVRRCGGFDVVFCDNFEGR
jgi:hypothetical protein